MQKSSGQPPQSQSRPGASLQMSAELQTENGYPDMLQQFHSLYPLDDSKASGEQLSRALGVQTQVMKGINMHDGAAFAIRRFSWRQVHSFPFAFQCSFLCHFCPHNHFQLEELLNMQSTRLLECALFPSNILNPRKADIICSFLLCMFL